MTVVIKYDTISTAAMQDILIAARVGVREILDEIINLGNFAGDDSSVSLEAARDADYCSIEVSEDRMKISWWNTGDEKPFTFTITGLKHLEGNIPRNWSAV